jgi:tetratricopeptide (TPR) repeat protein
LQGEVAQAIALQIEVAVTPDEEARLAAIREIDREAYEAYLRGMYYLNKYTPEGIEQGLAHLQQAIEIDPANALAYSGLAAAYSDFAHMPMPGLDAFPRARAAALRALSLDDTLAEAHLSMGEVKLYYEWDMAGAESYFQRALELDPNSARAHMHYGWYLDIVGRPDEAGPRMERAVELDPFYPIFTAWLGWWHWWCTGQYDKAIEIAHKSLELNPDLPQGYYVLGGAYAEKGMFEEAIAARERFIELRSRAIGYLGETYALAGRRDEAEKIAAELAETRSRYWVQAHLHAALGQKDEAFRCLEESLERRFLFFPWVRKVPTFKSLQDDPRFDDLMRRAGLES